MATLLLRNGRVVTPTGTASAVLVDGDTVAWVGDTGPVDRTVDGPGPTAERVVDLAGRWVTPAFVDAHVHLAETGLTAMGADLSTTRSADEALHLLAVQARVTTLGVVLGQNWDETRWAGAAAFDRARLDEAVAGRPAYVSRVDLHSAHASTALLDTARTLGDRAVDDLPGWSADGPVSRDAHHAVRDAARSLLTAGDRAAAVRLALQTAASRGVGMVHEMGAPHVSDPEDLALAGRLGAEASSLGVALPEVVGYWGELGGTRAAAALDCAGAAGDLCVDGAIGSRTAALHAPYADAPGERGHLYVTADQVAAHVVACTEAGLQAGFHVIGDRAVAEVVEGLAGAASRLGTDAVRRGRHRLEHLEMVTRGQMRLLADLQVTASMQPLFEAWWGGPGGLYETRLGGRARGMNPFGSLARAGVPLAFGSDSPVTPFDPWASVRAATLHPEPGERMALRAALSAHTEGGWRAAGRDRGGRLEPGAPASLAVWEPPGGPDLLADPRPGDPVPVCSLTLVRGAVAHDGSGLLGGGFLG